MQEATKTSICTEKPCNLEEVKEIVNFMRENGILKLNTGKFDIILKENFKYPVPLPSADLESDQTEKQTVIDDDNDMLFAST